MGGETPPVISTFVLQCLRRLVRPSRRDDACECTAQHRRQREEWREAEIIEMHARQVVVGETERQDCANADAERNLNEGALEDGGQDLQRHQAVRQNDKEICHARS